MTKFREELEGLINKHGKENASDTPDFILAAFLVSSLNAFDRGIAARERWYGRKTEGIPDEHKVVQEMSARGAVTGFAAWLTTRPGATVFGSNYEAGSAAWLVKQFCDVNQLPELDVGWEEKLVHPKV
jgi:hypothetical protein